MKRFFDFGQQRTFVGAALFYVCHLVIVVVTGACAGIVAAQHAPANSVHAVSHYAGLLVGLIYATAICVAVIRGRNLTYHYYPLVAVTSAIAVLFGGMAALLISAFLTTRGAKTDSTSIMRRQIAALNSPKRGPTFGQRAFNQ